MIRDMTPDKLVYTQYDYENGLWYVVMRWPEGGTLDLVPYPAREDAEWQAAQIRHCLSVWKAWESTQ